MKQGIFLALLLGLCLRAGSLGAQDVCGHDGRQIRAILENIRSEYAPDKRVAVFEIAAADTAD